MAVLCAWKLTEISTQSNLRQVFRLISRSEFTDIISKRDFKQFLSTHIFNLVSFAFLPGLVAFTQQNKG